MKRIHLKKILLFFVTLFLFSVEIAAQEKNKITGIVTDASGEALIGVTVVEVGTSNGTITGLDGDYTITLQNGSKLQFSFIGYATATLSTSNQSVLNVTLDEDSQLIDEVVVVGYGVQSKKDLTGAIAVVGSEEMKGSPVTDFGTAIAGRTPGVQVISSSGKPSAGFSIRVRGATSVNAGNEPLYIVDGVPTTDTKSINQSDIESISVLKDASSAAIYGSSGANGVVLITTKRGRQGDAKVELSTSVGLSTPPAQLGVLNTAQYGELLSELGYPSYDTNVYNANINWQDQMYSNALYQNYQLSVSGGTEKTSYYFGGGFVDQEGIIAPSSFRRYNVRANVDSNIKKWFKMGANMSYNFINDVDVSDGSSENVILKTLTTPSIVGEYNELGQYMTLPFLSSLENPYAGIKDYTKDYISHNLTSNVFIELLFTEHLKLRSSLGLNVTTSRYKEFLDPFLSDWGRNQMGSAKYNTSFSNELINENILSYTRKIEDHNFMAMGGFIAQRRQYEGAQTTSRGFTSNKLQNVSAGTILVKPNEWYGANTNASFLARATYDYKSRYLATVNFRADGSSKFGKNNKWGYFPSFSFGWRMSSEEFMSPAEGWLDDLKVRTGWGLVGNDGVGNYSAYGIYGIGANYNVDNVILPGYYQSQIGNDKLKWEKTSQANIGVDFSAFGGRLIATLDAYYKYTTDLLLSVKLPQTSGFDSGMQNIGSISNKGVEFQISSVNIDREFKWATDFNISTNVNNVVDMANVSDIYTGGLDKKIGANASIIREGESLGSFYGYKAHGVNPDNGRMMYENAEGMLVYENELNENTDRRIIGNAQAKLLYGLNNTFSWKGIELSFFFQGSYGNDIYNAARMFTEGMFDSRNQSDAVLNRWQNPGDYTAIPRAEKDKYPLVSSRFIEDGSYLKLKNLKLAYTLPANITRKALIDNLTFYVSGENLLTFTQYSGYDPEVNIGGGSATAMGIDQGVFPHAQTYSLGAVITF